MSHPVERPGDVRPADAIVRLRGIGKAFGPVRVLDGVDLDLHPGEVHVLAGENGAGKSTLIKILGGIHRTYDGDVELAGRTVKFATPLAANRAGISVIHQELSLVESMSVADNILLGREPTRCAGWWFDRRAAMERALTLCRQLDLDFTPTDLRRAAGQFSMSEKNRIEIAKALTFDAKVLVMDEPTGALSRREVERLFDLIASLRERGCALVYISHKMEEIYRIADRITVLRNGRLAGTAIAAECPEPKLISWMLGRDLEEQFKTIASTLPSREATPRLTVRNLNVPNRDPARPNVVRGLSLDLRPGEIVGLAGLQGSGASEVLHALFGVEKRRIAGEIQIDGTPFYPRDPRDSIRRGIALLTADRKGTGLIGGLSVAANVSLAALPRLSPGGWRRPRSERACAESHARALNIRLAAVEQAVNTLSGGNQQKVVLAKWLETAPKILLLDEPTRGVDVGAKHEIYGLMRQWAAEGRSILMVSTELPELLALADRIVVLHRGGITGVFGRAEATPEKILTAALGGAAA